jgi:hypothetical protein
MLALGQLVLRVLTLIATCAVLGLQTDSCHPSPRPLPGPEVVRPPQLAPPRAGPPKVASPPKVGAAATCDPLPIDPYGVRQSSRQVYAAALRTFLTHTAPGSAHALSPDLERERPSLRFGNTSRRETGEVMQATMAELTTRYPDSIVVPAAQPLRPRTCYDEVYLDLTEDGAYFVIVETDTARPVFMYWTSYRP